VSRTENINPIDCVLTPALVVFRNESHQVQKRNNILKGISFLFSLIWMLRTLFAIEKLHFGFMITN